MDDYTRANRDAVAQLTAIGAPFEVETRYYEGVPLKAYKNAEPNLAQLMAPGRQFGDATFVQYPGQSLTYNAFWLAVDRLTAALITELGIVSGDRVAIAMRSSVIRVAVSRSTASQKAF
jgi:long-chain acyl-CoA synthetase